MVAFDLADNYRAAGLNPGPEILRLREAPFEALRNEISARRSVDLARLYFGLTSADTDWFKKPFREADSSFSLHDNAREIAILAGGLLHAAILDGKMHAALATLTTAAGGLRVAAVRPEFVSEAAHALGEKAVRDRHRARANPEQIKIPAASKVPAEAATLAPNGDWAKTATLFKQVSDEWHEATKTLANQTAWTTRPLAEDIADLREEVAMLWWHIGGWSRILDRPFAELEPALAAAMAGIDLADLSRTITGPIAAAAILQRTIGSSRKSKAVRSTVQDAVDAFPQNASPKLSLGEALENVPDVCPVLTAFAKVAQIGGGTAWHAAYKKAVGLEPSVSFAPFELAIQVYRERLLLRALAE